MCIFQTSKLLKPVRCCIFLILFFEWSMLALPLIAQTTRPLTVQELFQMGLENSLKLKSSQVNVHIAKELEGTAATNKLPSVDLNVTGGYLGDPTLFLGGGLSNPTRSEIPNWLQNYDVSLIQPLYRGGKIKYNIQKTALQSGIAKLNLERDQAEIKLLLIEKYLELYKVYKAREVLESNIKDAKQRLHDIRGMKKEGMITGNDVIRSELELTNYELALREVNDNIAILSQQLDIALGLDENLLLRPDSSVLSVERPLSSYEQYVEDAYTQYPEMKLARTGTELAKKNLQITQADYLPSLSLKVANFLDRPILKTTPVVDYFSNNWNALLILSYNLSSLYQNKHNVNAGRGAVVFQKFQEDQQKQNIRMNLKAAYVKYEEAIDRVEVLQISVKQAYENYRIVQNKYFNQLSVLTDLLDASTVRVRTELQLEEARANMIFAYYRLQRWAGKI